MSNSDGRMLPGDAGVLWFFSNPVVVTAAVKPLQPNAALPTFKRVDVPLRPSS
jgi:hypothetical protein